ncbi:DUF3426 domain-containing protein [Xanthomonas hortorum]|uniref:DUF3426 domain-containing protein n=1 Tax=Xanthomonas hortorum TaxID=56454 RepID=UPI0015D5DC11|nr:DUF3426 domain-containing protein [Xanthomonas hortorum]MCE4358365.1 DUF3426 domain-containing protein [Xanthomonas hortorum pv. taraxaci]NMI52790.1 DUF3426 domain-containing protein [Xanthomonas hortorum pv. taraxaci]CAD0353252.1 hypothetical protein NCPPB940_38360 [Xanthomonas hortorum pv. taraxaci]CAD0353258.1 hypothetical protein NCPPB940_38360 [Xanthomonas hortorum pv. taraxaci]
MSETPPPRRPLATFLRATPAAPSLIPTPAVPPAEPPEQPLPVPTHQLPPAPFAEPAAAPPAAVVPPPVAPLVTAPRADMARAANTTPRSDDGQTAAGDANPDRLGWNTSSTRDVPDDTEEDTTLGADDNRDAISSYAGTHSTGAVVGSIADAGRETDLDADADADADQHLNFDVDRDTTPDTAAAPASETAPQPATKATLSDAGHAGTTTAAHFQPLPAAAQPAPAFARRGFTRPRLRASGRQWALLIGLVGLLALQIVIADRAHLAADARWRPLVGAACEVLRCTLPAWREPAALTLLNRDVRPLPANPGVLQIQASFRNDARWAQAWPWLQLSLSDADGRVIGTRVLAPQEYLGQRPDAQDTLAPGQAVQVAFRVREPAASTAAFSFDFR